MTITMDELEQSKRAGVFTISPGKEIYGELTFAGPNTSLYLRDNEYFDTQAIPGQCVKGTLYDLTKVTLLHCITTSGTGFATRGKERYCFASIFPHYVLHGDRQIAPDDKTITEVHFVVDDASALFYDFDAFGSLIDARPFIEQIAHANRLEREIPIGPHPEILYFTGKCEIFKADTVLGRVSASHNPTHTLGGPDGVQLKNTIFMTIVFKEASTFDEAIAHTLTLLRYLGSVGRPPHKICSDSTYVLSLMMSGQAFSTSIGACHQDVIHLITANVRTLRMSLWMPLDSRTHFRASLKVGSTGIKLGMMLV